MDRQDSIVFQSSLKIALDIEKIRAEREGRDFDVRKMITLAKDIALVARNPQLNEHQKTRTKR